MKLSRTVAYALQATLLLAERGNKHPVPCSQLAAAGHMPERFLLQVLRNLVTHGILDSTRGVDGGYMLHRQAEDISLLDVIEAIEGPINAVFPLSNGLSEGSHQRLNSALEDITSASRRQIGDIKISNLMVPAANEA